MTGTNCWTSWAALVLFLGLIVVSTADEADLVTDLQGQPANVSFKHYAGYVTVDPGSPKARELFYWFFEADHPNASSRPVALWLQGGPGCSATGYGALSELGPFLIKNGNLVSNKYSWNKEVNLIFVDSPVNVGFSYSNDTTGYEYNDYNTAVDSYKFLVGWFKKFPQYSTNELYLLGESYAGHYAPELALQILIENRNSSDFKLNFRGFNLGNPWTDTYLDNTGTLQWYLSHSLISEETFNLALLNCNLTSSYFIGDVGNAACKEAENEIFTIDLREVDLDNVYEDTCNIENATINSAMLFNRMPSKRQRLSSSWHHGQNPCAPDGVLKYLNTPAVQKALHVPTHVNFTYCSEMVGNLYSHVDSVASMLPVYRQLLKTGIKMWIYSGDWDGNVPTTATRAWIKSLELPIVMKWRPWDYQSQVGGWTQVYKGLTFTTVRGAGHMVPTDQPGKALEVLRSFLAGEPLPMFHLNSNRR